MIMKVIRVTSKAFHTTNIGETVAHHYVIAGQPVVFESAVASLKAYHIGTASERFSELLLNFEEPALLNASSAILAYHGVAPIDKKDRRVRFWRHGRCAQIDIDAVPACYIDFDENHIHLLGEFSYHDPMGLELVTGPALVLLLAELGTYSLHAGAVLTQIGSIAVIAESGAGKSTLCQSDGDDWRRLSDDVLPIDFAESMNWPDIHLDFPQLKLTNAAVDIVREGPVKLDYLLRLNPRPHADIRFEELDKAPSMLQIVRHTVAAKLFNKNQMRHHASFAKEISKVVPMLQVHYPRDKSLLPKLRQEIVDAFVKLSDSSDAASQALDITNRR